MTTTTYDFSTASDYNFNSNEIEIVGGQAQLKLEDNTGQTLVEDFADDTGFTYDSGKSEFTGGLVRTLAKPAPTDETFFVSAAEGADAARFTSTGTATANNGATLVTYNGNQYLDFTQQAGANYTYPAGNFLTTGGTRKFTMSCKIVPNFTGAPGVEIDIIQVYETTKLFYGRRLWVNTDGGLYCSFYATNGGFQNQMGQAAIPWVAGQEYDVECSISTDGGSELSYLFLDGVLIDTVSVGSVGQASYSNFEVGDNNSGKSLYIRDIQWFETRQNTTGFAVPRNIYTYYGDKVTLPLLSYDGIGSIQSWQGLTNTDTGTPQYTLNGLYWDGSAWSSADGTVAQSNTKTTINTNIASLAASNSLQIVLFLEESSVRDSVDNLSMEYTGQIYPTDDPVISVINANRIASDGLTNFTESITTPANTAIQYVMVINGTKTYWNGSSWIASNGTFAQSNTAADILTNIATLVTSRKIVGFDAILRTTDGASTPKLDTLTLVYEPALPDPTAPTLVDLAGFIYIGNDPYQSLEIKVRPYQSGFSNSGGASGGIFHAYAWDTIATTTSEGYFSGGVFLQPDTKFWEIKVGKQSYYTQLPEQDIVDFADLTITLVED